METILYSLHTIKHDATRPTPAHIFLYAVHQILDTQKIKEKENR